MKDMILAGDIGGTSTRLAIASIDEGWLKIEGEFRLPSGRYPSLESLLHEAMPDGYSALRAACFGVAGPVHDRRVEATNLPWIIDALALEGLLGTRVELLNDLEATALGLPLVAPEDIVVINAGRPDATGNQAVIAAGTGLGEAGLFWNGHDHVPFPSEGGHADFAPRTNLEIELLEYLLARFEHVSVERVLSGPGLVNIYTFLRETGRGDEPAWLTEAFRESDPSAAISEAALSGRSDLCRAALDLFVTIYGAEAGNLALKFLATGGVFVGGGIAPKILPALVQPSFLEAYLAKGRMRPLLEGTPLRVVLNQHTALLGAARYAARLAGEREVKRAT